MLSDIIQGHLMKSKNSFTYFVFLLEISMSFSLDITKNLILNTKCQMKFLSKFHPVVCGPGCPEAPLFYGNV